MSVRPVLLAAALAATCIPAFAAEKGTAAIREVFQAHETAFNSHNLKGVMELYAPGDKTVAMGTGPGEVWVGHAAIEGAYKHFFADFDAGTLKRSCPWELGNVSRNVGWMNATCEYHDSLKDKPRSYALNISVVLQKLHGAWKIRAMHFSNLTGGSSGNAK
jgi:uncharacterized protein (TIGR02246 family)